MLYTSFKEEVVTYGFSSRDPCASWTCQGGYIVRHHEILGWLIERSSQRTVVLLGLFACTDTNLSFLNHEKELDRLWAQDGQDAGITQCSTADKELEAWLDAAEGWNFRCPKRPITHFPWALIQPHSSQTWKSFASSPPHSQSLYGPFHVDF
jgi:hypothetical protein